MDFNKASNICLKVSATFVLALPSCNYSFDNYNPSSIPGATNYNLTIDDLINDTPTDAEKTSTTFQVKKTGTTEYGCRYDSSALNNSSTVGISSETTIDTITSNVKRTAALVTTPTAMNIQAVKIVAYRLGGESGSASIEINLASGGVPSSTNLATTTSRNMLDFPSVLEDWIQFSLSSSLTVSAQKELALILKPQFTGTPNGVNYITLVSTSDYDYNDPIACNLFPIYKTSSDGGATWASPWNDGTPENADLRRAYFLLVADVHRPAGQGHWVVQADKEVLWHLSSFIISENPNGMGGSVTYDVGASNENAPTYSKTNLTKAQMLASPNLSGRFLFIRVNLQSSAYPYFERAEISGASISATPLN